MKDFFGKARLSQRDMLRAFGGDVLHDGSWIIPLNDVTTVPVLDSFMKRNK